MDNTKVNDGREKHRTNEGDVNASTFQSARSHARSNIVGLAPDVSLAAKVLPPMVVQEVLQVTKVTSFGIDVPYYGSRALGLGLNFLADGIDEKVRLEGLAFVLPSSTVAVNDENIDEFASFPKRASIHHGPACVDSLLKSISDSFDREHGVLFMAGAAHPSRGVAGIGCEGTQMNGSFLFLESSINGTPLGRFGKVLLEKGKVSTSSGEPFQMGSQGRDVFDFENGTFRAIPPCVLHVRNLFIIGVVTVITEAGKWILEVRNLAALLLSAFAVRTSVVMSEDAPLRVGTSMDRGSMAVAGLRVQAITIMGKILFII